MNIRKFAMRAASFSALTGALAVYGPALAQSTQKPAVDSAPTVDTIVVTAQKRVQSLQNVPIVVTAVGHQLLQDTGVNDIKDLTVLTPGLLVTSTTSEATTTARIRGIGTVGDNVGLESSVGIVIDGVYRPRNGVGFGDLGNVDRIEVLKGPQSTLFGKSTTAGVINILTEQPSFQFGGHAEATVGNYNTYGGSASVTGPLIGDKVAASLYVADRQRDGFYNVVTAPGPNTDTRDQNRNFYTLRAQVLAVPNDRLSVRVIGDYTLRQEHCCVAVEVRPGETVPIDQALGGAGGGEPTTPNPFKRTAYANQPDAQNINDGGLSAEVNYKFPDLNATLTSITSYRDWKVVTGGDIDFSTADMLYRPVGNNNSDEFKTFTQEVRFAGTAGPLDYLVGGFYANEDLHSNLEILYGSDFNSYLGLLFSGGASPTFLQQTFGANYQAGTGSIDHYHQVDNTYALFTNETYHVTDKFEINLGLRGSDDDKRLSTASTNTNGGAGCAAIAAVGAAIGGAVASVIEPATCLPFESPGYNNFTDHQAHSEQNLSGALKLTYRFNPSVLAYASYSRGYKAGGFNLDRVQCIVGQPGCAAGSAATITPIADTGFAPETVDAYEVGVKSTLLHRTLILNATLFDQDYHHFQLNSFNGYVFVVDSVPEVVSQGIDADFVWLPTRNLSFQGGLTIADTHFVSKDYSGLLLTGYLGSPNQQISLAPKYSSSIAATYTQPLTDDFDLRFNVDVKYSSAYETGSDLDPGKMQKAYTLTNARVVFGPKTKQWSVEVWADNLFDTHYLQVAFDAPYQNAPTNATGVLDGFLGAPRTFGATVRAKF